MYLRWTDEDHAAMEYRSLDSTSRSLEIRAVLAVFSVLSTIAVVLRTYIRSRLLRSFGWDDGLMVIAQVLVIGSAVAIGLENKYGLGYHSWDQPKHQYIPYMKAFYASVVVYNVAMCMVKIGLLFQYRRVFALPIIQLITFYGLVFMVVWTVIIAFLNILICVPVAKFWDHTISGKCLDQLVLWYVMAGFNLATDIAIFCIPLPVVRSLQLPRKQKVMLLVIFSIGFLTCIISIVRIRTLKTAASTKDPNWDNVDAAIWSFLEVTLAIIAACLPTLRSFFSRIMPSMFASSRGQSGRHSSYAPYVHAPSTQCLSNMRRTKTEERGKRSLDDESTLYGDDNVPSPSRGSDFTSPLKPAVSVSITAGQRRSQCIERTQSQHPTDTRDPYKAGIQTTTVVTQQIAMGRVSEEEWDTRSPTSSDATL
ncbi:hypothetical protein FSARC_13476 [Fusarium sarcochroum]|uniref:Rhodopsin domain-containing protein n=1 Tax=Fusarium sarcochroum TaxID=1208366 RepID=A0A8H4T198_9HYPO|nr:hypothetical protein FSARC_13476 [Fusarium sarcochroum]